MKKKPTPSAELLPPEIPIREIRGQRVLLDSDLAAIYGVTTAAFNQAVKRNLQRFPDEFAFLLNQGEFDLLISQSVISKPSRGGRTKLPRVFTEHGALQAANVLRSPRAVAMSVFVIRAFVAMRATFLATDALAKKLAELEARLTGRLDTQEHAIVHVMHQLVQLLAPARTPPAPPKPKIGFKP